MVNFNIQKLKSKHLVCLNFLWWQVFWGNESKQFPHILDQRHQICQLPWTLNLLDCRWSNLWRRLYLWYSGSFCSGNYHQITVRFLNHDPLYRVGHKFSDTWNELFVVNWFISNFFWGNTKWKKVSSPHYLKILMKLSKHGISYSLKRDPRSISKITFYADLRVSPVGTELW